jgi:hypothetical protein
MEQEILWAHLGVNLGHVKAGSHAFDMIVDQAKEWSAAHLIHHNFADFGSSFGGIRADKKMPQPQVPYMNDGTAARSEDQ